MESLDSLPGVSGTQLPDLVSTADEDYRHLPPGDYFPRQDAFEATFVTGSRQRAKIYEGWKKHRNALQTAGLPTASRQLLNGSFTTSKPTPGDIDLAVEVPDADQVFQDSRRLQAIVALLRGPEMKPEFDCDAYPIYVFPEEHPHYRRATVEGIRYWTKWFARTRLGNCKGRVWVTVGGFHE